MQEIAAYAQGEYSFQVPAEVVERFESQSFSSLHILRLESVAQRQHHSNVQHVENEAEQVEDVVHLGC